MALDSGKSLNWGMLLMNFGRENLFENTFQYTNGEII